MSSVLIFSKRKKIKRNNAAKTERFFIGLVIFLVLTIILEILFHFFLAPAFAIKKIEIAAHPGSWFSDSDIIKIIGIGPGDSYFDVKGRIIKQHLLAIPSVRAVTVKKIFPSTLYLNIVERVPIGLCFVSGKSGTTPFAVDTTGIIFPINRTLNASDYPIISGIDVPLVKNGARLPRPLCSFLEDLEKIRNASPELFSLISEIKFVKKNGMDYDVVLYPGNSKIKVRIGNSLDVKMFKYIIMVLDVIKTQKNPGAIEEIDLRSGRVVYKIRGE